MTDIETERGSGMALLPGAHRVVRTLDEKEGPFTGVLVTSGDDVAVRVDAAALSGWVGWRYAGAEHVAAPLDVIRREGGHDVLLPWCTDRVLGFLVRRAAAGTLLTPGECSTLAISLLRGLHEVGRGSEETRGGVWWVTDGGRPVFVLGGGPDVREGVREILGQLKAHSADKVLRRALDVVEQGLDKTAAQPSLPDRLLELWEQELLAVAAPQPLDRTRHAPERARNVARTITSHDLAPVGSNRGLRPAERLRSGQRLRADRSRARGRGGITEGVQTLRDAVRAAAVAISARVVTLRGASPGQRPEKEEAGARPHPPRRRRRSLIVAGAAAGVVLAAGLLWPDGGESGEAADDARSVAAQGPSGGAVVETPAAEITKDSEAGDEADEASPEPESPDEGGSSQDDDPVVAAQALLRTIGDCRAQGDVLCADAVAPGAPGVVDALDTSEPGPSTVELVDEYGDVAVVRLTPSASERGDAPSAEVIMVVLIRTQEKWLVRDVYDVADQPG
jgi:hypothetical protein